MYYVLKNLGQHISRIQSSPGGHCKPGHSHCFLLALGRFAAGLPNQTAGSRLLAPPRAVLWSTTAVPAASSSADSPTPQVRMHIFSPSMPPSKLGGHISVGYLTRPKLRTSSASILGCCLVANSSACTAAGRRSVELPRQPGRRCARDERSGELAARQRLAAHARSQVSWSAQKLIIVVLAGVLMHFCACVAGSQHVAANSLHDCAFSN